MLRLNCHEHFSEGQQRCYENLKLRSLDSNFEWSRLFTGIDVLAGLGIMPLSRMQSFTIQLILLYSLPHYCQNFFRA